MTTDSDTLAIPAAFLAEIEAEAANEAKRAQERHGRVVRKVSDMSPAELAAIAAVEMDPRHNHLDAKLG